MDPASAGTTALELRSRRRDRARLAQHLQHAVPAVVLLTTGAQALRAGVAGLALALALVEVLAGGAMLAMVLRALRHARRGHEAAHGPVDWTDLAAAAMLFAEAWHHRHETGHVPRPILLLAVTMLALAFLHTRIARATLRRRSLIVAPEGVTAGTRPLQAPFRAAWSDLAPIEATGSVVTLRSTDGRSRRIDLADLHNEAAVRALLEEAEARRLALLPPEASPDA